MRRVAWLAAAVVLLGGTARASGPLAVVAVVDRVVPEPSAGTPERLQVWGTFVFAQDEGRSYAPPAYGYLYYAPQPAEEEAWRRAAADLSKLAGSGQVVGWGDTDLDRNLGRVRRPGERPDRPDPFPEGNSLHRLRADSTFAPVRALATTPAPAAPAGDEAVPAGKVELVARNARSRDRAGANYVFEIESASGEREMSPPVAAGNEETRWSPRLEVKDGERYTWHVWAVAGDRKGPAGAASFRGKKAP
jgi:hypothetical protein